MKIQAYYTYHGAEYPMTFSSWEFGANGVTRFSGSDEVGPFTANGVFRQDGQIMFIKQYASHSISYTGKIEQGQIVGRWDNGHESDTFRFLFEGRRWIGAPDILLNIYVNDTVLIAIGRDKYGFGRWKGTYNLGNSTFYADISYADGKTGHAEGTDDLTHVYGQLTCPNGEFSIDWESKEIS